MPELPEVQTTVNGLNSTVIGLKISDVWSDYNSAYFKGSSHIKDPNYFKRFRQEIIGQKIIRASRRAKNVLIHLNNVKIILIHMKMTGHLMYGRYQYDAKNSQPWLAISPPSLKDPFNRHIHFVISFSNGYKLVLSDSRKFAKITLIDAKEMHNSEHLKNIGPEPLDPNFTYQKFKTRLFRKANAKIKQVITNQEIVAGIGNIYADESLWLAGIHPLEKVCNISDKKIKDLHTAIKKILSKSISIGGDSMSDYRNIHGEKGKFQEQHFAYQQTGQKCAKRGCHGLITRIVIGSRSAHFCNCHQKLSIK